MRWISVVRSLGIDGRVRRGCTTLVRVAGADQRSAHFEAVQEALAASAID